MADSESNIVTSNPFEILKDASKVSLGSGGTLLIAAYLFADKSDWKISGIIYLLVAGAILMATFSVIVKIIDVLVRAVLTSKVIQASGTADPKETKKLPVITNGDADSINKVLGVPVTAFLIEPGSQIKKDPDENPPI